MGRSAEANRVQRERARARLLAAATRLFAERGVEGTSMAQISKAARASKGLVYHYFATKEKLVAAVLERRVAQVEAVLAGLPEGVSDAERLGASARALLASVRADPEGYRLLLAALTHPRGGKAIRRAIRSRAAGQRERSAEAAKTFARLGAADPVLEQRFFQAGLVGILVLQATSPLAVSSERLVERLLGAVGAGGAT